jgi:hypothetical protein
MARLGATAHQASDRDPDVGACMLQQVEAVRHAERTDVLVVRGHLPQQLHRYGRHQRRQWMMDLAHCASGFTRQQRLL